MMTSSVIFLWGASANKADLVPSCFEPEYQTAAPAFNLNLHVQGLTLIAGSQARSGDLYRQGVRSPAPFIWLAVGTTTCPYACFEVEALLCAVSAVS